MNGKHYSHKIPEGSIKIRSSLSPGNHSSREMSSKSTSEHSHKAKSEISKSFDISELKKDPDFFKHLIDTAIKIEKKKSTGATYELNFTINYCTVFGERIVITGNPDFLGNWNPLSGLELEWSPGNDWRVSILIGEGVVSDFEYKYVCIKANDLLWESGQNRVFHVSQGIKQGSSLVFKKYDVWQE
jgi:Starch binding domain